MTTFPVSPGDSLIKIAQEQLGDWRRWRDVASENGLNVLEQLPLGNIQLPDLAKVNQYAQPIFTAISAGRNGGGDISALIQSAAEAAGYGKQAQKALGIVNGVRGAVESVSSGELGDRVYQQAGVQLVDWLLQ